MGRFIITGSSSPELLQNISESLAGRIAIVELGTFKTNEIEQKPLSPIYNLIETGLTREGLDSLAPPHLTQGDLTDSWFLGGYPEPRLLNHRSFSSIGWRTTKEHTSTEILPRFTLS